MLHPIKNNTLESALQNPDLEFDFHNMGQFGFTLYSNIARIEFNHFGPTPLHIDFSTSPHIRLRGNIDPRDKSPHGIDTYSILALSSDPNGNSECNILAESTMKKPISLEDFNGDTGFYTIIKKLEEHAKQYSTETNIKPQKEWFENSNEITHKILVKSNFYETYDNWFREVKFPRLSHLNRIKYSLGLNYKFK